MAREGELSLKRRFSGRLALSLRVVPGLAPAGQLLAIQLGQAPVILLGRHEELLNFRAKCWTRWLVLSLEMTAAPHPAHWNGPVLP